MSDLPAGEVPATDLGVSDVPGGPRVAVITGGASGIGLALARRFTKLGWSVAIADVDPEALAAAARSLTELGSRIDLGSGPGRVIGVVTDVAEEASVQALAARVADELGVPEVVCNNAGVNAYGYRSWEAPAVTWEWIWGVNVMGVVHGINAFVPLLLDAGRGRIVNTASVAGLAAAPGVASYAATKHAVVAISESLRLELAEMGAPVGVSVVCPGLIATDIGRSARHWPERLGASAGLGPAAAAYTDELESARAAAPGPDIVADAVLDAIEHDRFLVFPDVDTAELAHTKRTAVFEPLAGRTSFF